MNKQLIEIARKTQYDATTHKLGPSPKQKNLVTVVDDAMTITAKFSVVIKQRSEPLACEAGCHFCCYLMATVSAPEALTIAQRLRETYPAEELKQVKRKVNRSFKRTRKLDSHARIRAKVACPLLSDDGICTIYQFRPLDCMTYHSLNRQACEEIMAEPTQAQPTNPDLQAIGIGVKTGFGQAIAGADLETPALRYELIEAIQIALNDPHAMKKYLAGKNVFKSAAIITDNVTGIGYKIKYAPAHLKAEAKRVFELESRRLK